MELLHWHLTQCSFLKYSIRVLLLTGVPRYLKVQPSPAMSLVFCTVLLD